MKIRFVLFIFILYVFSFSISFAVPDKELLRLNGTVDVRHGTQSPWDGVFSIASVTDRDWIRTHEASLAKLVFNGGDQNATIYERTVVQVADVRPEKVTFFQYLGRLKVEVKHLFGKPTQAEIQTPSAVVAIKGSEADILVLPDETTYVSVGSGDVSVTGKATIMRLNEGQSTVVLPNETPAQVMNQDFTDAQGNLYNASSIDSVKEVSGVSTDQVSSVDSTNLISDSINYVDVPDTSWGISLISPASQNAPSDTSSVSSTADTASSTTSSDSTSTTDISLASPSSPLGMWTFQSTTSNGNPIAGLIVGDNTNQVFFGFGTGPATGLAAAFINSTSFNNGIAVSPSVMSLAGSSLAGTFDSSTGIGSATLTCQVNCSGTSSLSFIASTSPLPSLYQGTYSDLRGSSGNVYSMLVESSSSTQMIVSVFASDTSGGSVVALVPGVAIGGSASMTGLDWNSNLVNSSGTIFGDTFFGSISQGPGMPLGGGFVFPSPATPATFSATLQSSATPVGVMTGTISVGSTSTSLNGFLAINPTFGVFVAGSPVFGVGGGYVQSGALNGLLLEPAPTPANSTNPGNLLLTGNLTVTAVTGSFSGSFDGSVSPVSNPTTPIGNFSGMVLGTFGQVP